MKPRRFLFTCHDAGGTVPPVIALAESLVRKGHDVSILSQPSVRKRAEAAGCGFFSFSAIPDYERRKQLEDQIALTLPVIVGKSVGDDLISVARERHADLVVVDANLGGALAAAETLGQPSVVLLHSMYKTFVDTWFADIWPFVGPGINQTRDDYGLGPATDWLSVFAGHERLLSVVPTVFDAPVAKVPDAMRHFGFLTPRNAAADGTVGYPPGAEPTVLVGLSTTYQHQEALLQRIVDALGRLPVRALVSTAGQVDTEAVRPPPNVAIADFVPHALVLGETDVMVTHAGLGSVAAALSFGVPLVCTPISRDQPLNAARVAELGAGLALDSDAGENEIASGVEQVLSEPDYRRAAESIAESSGDEGGAAAAAAELESLLD